ncbi:MAG TPA: hypothetical protein VLB76_12460 [Thermoanaerobaculia bacterium]|jgi:hypothetical protein|nr:hypothetical protein [Thermoanaerobaculia bacterium]
MKLKPPSEDLEQRRPVWDALSSLFLDTDVSLLRDWRSSALAASPYSVEEIEEVLVQEVFPVCSWNLFSVAGEWAGFDLEWLEAKILRRWRPQRRWSLGRYLVRRSWEWRRTREAVVSIRGKSAGRHYGR